MKFNETSIPNNFVQTLKTRDMNFKPENVDKIFHVLFTSISDFLASVQSKDKKTALVVQDLKGNFKFAAMVGYHSNEDDTVASNYSFSYTTDKADIGEATIYTIADNQFARVASSVAFGMYGMRFNQQTFIIDLFESAATTLLQWLDINADVKEEKSVELEGYFVASVAVENDVKIMAIIPDGPMKKFVKGDSVHETSVA